MLLPVMSLRPVKEVSESDHSDEKLPNFYSSLKQHLRFTDSYPVSGQVLVFDPFPNLFD